MKNLRINVLAVLAIITISSCSKDDEVAPVVPPAVNEEEVITTVTTVFTEAGGTNTVTLKSKDLDGDGPGAPVVTVIPPTATFALNKTYNGVITVLNETVTPAANISTEILAEAADHQFFYEKTGTLPAFVYTPVAEAANNYDSNGKPLGYKTTFVTGATGSTGTLKVTLRHKGDKSKPNVATGDITNATGATDFAVTYTDLKVQ